jgi:hypothetical protein
MRLKILTLEFRRRLKQTKHIDAHNFEVNYILVYFVINYNEEDD